MNNSSELNPKILLSIKLKIPEIGNPESSDTSELEVIYLCRISL